MSMKTMNHFFQPQAKAPEPKMIHWKTKRQGLEGTTARVDVFMKARIGSHVMHTKHGKATLLGQPATDLLEIEIKTTDTSEWPVPGGILTTRKIADALDCYDAVAIARERDQSIYLTESDWTLAKAVVSRAIGTIYDQLNDFLVDLATHCFQIQGPQKITGRRVSLEKKLGYFWPNRHFISSLLEFLPTLPPPLSHSLPQIQQFLENKRFFPVYW